MSSWTSKTTEQVIGRNADRAKVPLVTFSKKSSLMCHLGAEESILEPCLTTRNINIYRTEGILAHTS